MEHKVSHKTKRGVLTTSNSSAPTGDGRFDWEIRLDPESSKEVEEVVYVLHETFPDPVRVKRDPDSGFALKSNGWGEFDVGLKVRFKDGSVANLKHPLKLGGEG